MKTPSTSSLLAVAAILLGGASAQAGGGPMVTGPKVAPLKPGEKPTFYYRTFPKDVTLAAYVKGQESKSRK